MSTTESSGKVVYLMRGLPSCGKSHRARRLAGAQGVICETDEYFYLHVGDDPSRYDFHPELLPAAREWNFDRFKRAVDGGSTPIVVDRGNSLCAETRRYALYAVEHGYTVELAEPDSDWWQELRVLLKHKRHTRPVLRQWAKKLSEMSRGTHRVPADEIFRRMEKWKSDLTVQDILEYEAAPSVGQFDPGPAPEVRFGEKVIVEPIRVVDVPVE